MNNRSMTSWVESANARGCHFPVRNLPYGVFSRTDEPARCGVAIGTYAIDLAALERNGLFELVGLSPPFDQPTLNAFMATGARYWSAVRDRMIALLAEDGDPALKDDAELRSRALLPLADVRMHLPFKVAGFTDFYAGCHHASNVGTMLRGPDNALPPNWLSMPIGYNGRASTVVVSGTDIRRPLGQVRAAGAALPTFGPSGRLDIELEIGAVVGASSRMGQPVTVAEADDMIFGFVLLNDWSARDIQAWEYQPLGPFQAKVFATTISPWVVTKTALEPFRVAPPERERPLLPYLREPRPLLYDIRLEVWMQPATASSPVVISQTNSRELYYSAAQQIAHHAIGGCKMEIGDLIGSGTISGSTKGVAGPCWNCPGEEPSR
jgi:fumarylacetoacetase